MFLVIDQSTPGQNRPPYCLEENGANCNADLRNSWHAITGSWLPHPKHGTDSVRLTFHLPVSAFTRFACNRGVLSTIDARLVPSSATSTDSRAGLGVGGRGESCRVGPHIPLINASFIWYGIDPDGIVQMTWCYHR